LPSALRGKKRGIWIGRIYSQLAVSKKYGQKTLKSGRILEDTAKNIEKWPYLL
jgi:hypothetical protein